MKYSKVLMMLILLLSAGIIDAAPDETGFISVGFDDPRWDLEGAKVIQFKDRNALMGSALLKDIELENGVIKVDVYTTTKRRSYPGVLFRFLSPTDYERIYIRPHRSGLYPDTIQYVPCFNGIDGWQLYNGNGFTAIAEIPSETWFTLTIEFAVDQAKVYLGDQAVPSLLISDLKNDTRKGLIGLSGLVDNTSYFSNFRYKATQEPQIPEYNRMIQKPGMITQWELSKPFKASEIKSDVYPDTNHQKMSWQKVESDQGGLLDISRFVSADSLLNEPQCIYTRTTIHSDTDEVKKYQFGYSDIVYIYLNGRLLFSGDSTYRSRDLSFLGIVGLYDSVYLPLKKGDNELMFCVTEIMGGWGIICRDATAVHQDDSLSLNWTLEDSFKMPESIAFNPSEKTIYISNFDGYHRNPNQGSQSISKVGINGKILDLNWAKGLKNPTGITFYNGRIYAVERTGVAEIDASTGNILNRFVCPGGILLNDIAVTNEGEIFVSDSASGSIYIIKNGTAEVWFSSPNMRGANGLACDDENIYVLTNGDGCLKAISRKDKKQSVVAKLGSNTLDGLQLDKDGNFLFSEYIGRLTRLSRNGKTETLLDLTGPEISITDFCYDGANHLILAPSLYNNSIRIYTIK